MEQQVFETNVVTGAGLFFDIYAAQGMRIILSGTDFLGFWYKNIQHSLACYEDGGHFRHLRDLYETGELTGAINRIIERTVLYRGGNTQLDNGVKYLNVEEYLQTLDEKMAMNMEEMLGPSLGHFM